MKVRKNIFFTILRICGLFFTGMVVAVVIAFSQIDLESLRGNILSLLQDSTGLPVEIDGAVSWKFSLRPRIELNQVRVPNADWAKHKYAFSAEKIDVSLNLLSLFRDRPTIQNIKIYDADVCVEKNSVGQYSVVMNDVAVEQSADKSTPAVYPFAKLPFGGIEVSNLNLDILGRSYAVDGFNIRTAPRSVKREYAGWIKSGTDVFPYIVSFSEYNAERRVYPVQVAFSTGGDALIANIALEGTSKKPIDFVLKGEISNLGMLGEIVGWDFTQVPSVRVNIAGGYNNKKITLRKSAINIAGTDFTVSGDYDWSKNIPQINLNLGAEYVDLAQLFPSLYGAIYVKPNRALNVFKNIPLYGDYLQNRNIHLVVDFDNFIVYRDLNLSDFGLDIKLNNNHARVDIDTGFADGTVELGGDVDIDDDGRLFVRAGAIGERIYIGEILQQVHKSDFLSELPVNVEFYVEANGTNLSELMQTITGPVYIYSVASGYAHSALVAYMYGTDFLTTLRHSIQDLFRSEKKYNQIKISCVAMNVKLRDGVFETQNGFAIETNAINIRLAGSLDLGNEEMHLSLTTMPVRGLKLSLTGNVVNSIELTGSLAEPEIQISGATVAGKVASATGIGLLLAPFTGGLSVVAGAGLGLVAGELLENWLADDHPCETAMRRGAPDMRGDPEWLGMPMAELVNGILYKN